MMETRLKKQIEFILEADKIKKIDRQTYLSDGSRKENDAEHSWHIALMALLLQEYSNEKIDVLRVVIMVLIHDMVEIDAGDTYAYDDKGQLTKRERETAAAKRIFGMLPEDQGVYLQKIWEEFEAYETAESKYAHMLDNFQPLMLNDATNGRSWTEHGVKKSQVLRRNQKTGDGARVIMDEIENIIEKHVTQGHLKDE